MPQDIHRYMLELLQSHFFMKQLANDPFNPTDEPRSVFANTDLLMKLVNDQPGLTLTDLVAQCDAQDIDVVMTPRNGSPAIAVRTSNGKLWAIKTTPSALDQAISSTHQA